MKWGSNEQVEISDSHAEICVLEKKVGKRFLRHESEMPAGWEDGPEIKARWERVAKVDLNGSRLLARAILLVGCVSPRRLCDPAAALCNAAPICPPHSQSAAADAACPAFGPFLQPKASAVPVPRPARSKRFAKTTAQRKDRHGHRAVISLLSSLHRPLPSRTVRAPQPCTRCQLRSSPALKLISGTLARRPRWRRRLTGGNGVSCCCWHCQTCSAGAAVRI
jgi:hypothetical protein